MSILWNTETAVAATGGQCSADWAATSVSIDTRTLEPGALFVALKDVRDGHDFVASALEKGAVAALVSRMPNGVSPDAPLLIVDDVLTALEDLARAARDRSAAKVIGVTGSVGKTGTKDMLRCALAGQGQVHVAEKSYNNHWGVPLTLARMPQDTDFAVIEIGMNHPGEIGPLSRLVRPDVAVITTVAIVHMEAFENVAQIAQAKAEIFEGTAAGCWAVLNTDIETAPILLHAAQAAGCSIIGFGTDKTAHYRLNAASITGTNTVISANLHGEEALFKLAAPGRHLAMNAMAVLAAVGAVGADVTLGILALADWTAPDGRGARTIVQVGAARSDAIEVIDESYNANPTSMAAALEVLAAAEPLDNVGRIAKGRRIAFVGEMLELGPDEVALHTALAELDAMGAIDQVHGAGPLVRALIEALPPEKQGEWHADAQELADRAHHLLDAGDVAMIKGSNSSRISQVAVAIKRLDVDKKQK
jgi:UDP-N-acetylmuramoyl-tripeptide--D-alanyl-D-alanine ligase